jgi:DNA-binding IclR family transcriptional regulator
MNNEPEPAAVLEVLAHGRSRSTAEISSSINLKTSFRPGVRTAGVHRVCDRLARAGVIVKTKRSKSYKSYSQLASGPCTEKLAGS